MHPILFLKYGCDMGARDVRVRKGMIETARVGGRWLGGRC